MAKYKEWLEGDNLTLLEGWARRGLTDAQIAHNMGISAKTICEWKSKYSEFREALKKGKEVVDIEVENALLKRALGYYYEEETTEESDGSTRTRTVKRHMPPDTTAQIFWLKNRRPDLWRDKVAAPVEQDPIEDDGLLEALGQAKKDANIDDDSGMLPLEDAE